MNICSGWEYLKECIAAFWKAVGMDLCLCVWGGVFSFVPLYQCAIFIFWAATMAMRDMERASASQLSGTTQHRHQRTAASVKATLTALGK